ncbi:hypothetical protein GFY24_14290 [Nocardia sp. SYP-A9097]|uniref:hypothetical protein n=1 Tax=Nocardia sp. SYP-A9097 TaxID=2663237 RepID=UPI00129AB805|nr:hypothetical protein [Nocardia sp. SYP-A9097]MRH88598.1 hypothetical protein [Nocardia sp. SYP-A9097]
MTRLLEPSEVFHAFLDWQTGFEVEVPVTVTPEAAASGLARLYADIPRLGCRITRTPEGFAFEAVPAPALGTSDQGAQVDAPLSAFAIDISQPGTTRVTGRLHHALCDVTGILSIVDHLLGLIEIEPDAESIPDAAALDWPIAAERMLGGPQSADAIRQTRQFYSGGPSVPLLPAQPVNLHLEPALVQAIDKACATATASLTAVIATAAAPFVGSGTDDVVVGAPVDCRVFIDPARIQEIPPRAIGNCSHGVLVPIPRSARTPAEILATAQDRDAELMDQLDEETPAAPFRDGRRYLPEHNVPAQLVVSNARGAARRFARLTDATKVLVLPESSIPALPMIAVNESPASGAVDITLIADPADYTPTDVRRLVDALAHTLTEIGERQ